MNTALRWATVAAGASAAMIMASAHAEVVQVSIYGTIEYNQITAPPLGQFVAGEAATLTFLLDSNDFVNSGLFPTRGYVIDQSSFMLSSGGNSIGLASPFAGTPYFVLRDNDPAVDGFFLSSSGVDFPSGLDLDQEGVFGPFASSFSVTYTGGTLSSLDILDAVGTYDFTGLTVFNWAVNDGPFDPMFIDFEYMTIEVVPAPAGIALLGLAGLSRNRRRTR